MKRVLCFVLTICLMLTSMCTVVFASDEISIVINDKPVTFDQMPVIVDGRTLVPLRGISETLGAEVIYTADTQRVTVTRDGVVVKLKIGSTEAYIDHDEKTLDVPATVISDRTMVPVRFISEAYGSEVEWNGDTKTVVIKDNGTSKGTIAPLKSDLHRPVPTNFEKSNKIDDVMYFGVSDKAKKELPDEKLGTVILDGEKGFPSVSVKGSEYGGVETYKDTDGSLVLKMKSTEVLATTSKYIVKFTVAPEGEVGAQDSMLMVFDVRCVEGGQDNGRGIIQLQLEETTSGKYNKAVFDKVDFPKEWTRVYLPCTGVADATSFGIRPGLAVQTVEMKNFRLINYKNNVSFDALPKTELNLDFLNPGAKWREDAFDRIEKIRKGDFTVVVKDKDGNIIPGAQVELDMFEHEFQFGTSVRDQYFNNPQAASKLSENFNAGVTEAAMKWAPYREEATKKSAELYVTKGPELGLKNLRGHTLYWEVPGKTPSGNLMVPEDVQQLVKKSNKEALIKEIDKWAQEILPKFRGKLTDWDVTNESLGDRLIVDLMGNDIYKYYFTLARDLDPTCNLYYNETEAFARQDDYFRLLDWYESNDVDYDGVGIQTHRDLMNVLYDMNQVVSFYEKIRTKTNKAIKVTEYSCSIEDELIQADYTRDSLIAAFAEENMEGFLFWGYWDGSNFEARSPFYDKEFNLKPAGKAYQDLVYNKWWTRDAKAVSDAEGKAVINGYYGDYDVTVNANGKTVTKMVSFHKGYDNILEITIE